ncbi:Panacea domain-containing protein [Lichenihabitans sp. Uapishka_5]|uniref:Panacea domain-containing protein n=1 Tax=Lichenihabitans sp. Uapishka_5 TaxID=3037302 RepID=UPI0029E7D9D6|nr:Panacea domain-containing protein [Lichenihabitans sp. Uapishka_5]MDX7953616.1 Panacea domain-containing protein [Lichenihabitans sp. Uapishka_5]
MLISHEREKLIQAINFFVRNTSNCGKIKLFKLLYFFDFEHFKATGRSVTGLAYNAWPKGPVPVSLYNEIDAPQADLEDAFRFEQKPIRDGYMLKIHSKSPFDGRHFSRRERRLLDDLANEYRTTLADDMIEATHLENQPWDRVYHESGNPQGVIPYDLAIRPDEHEAVSRIASDRKELLEKLR